MFGLASIFLLAACGTDEETAASSDSEDDKSEEELESYTVEHAMGETKPLRKTSLFQQMKE